MTTEQVKEKTKLIKKYEKSSGRNVRWRREGRRRRAIRSERRREV